MKTAYLTSALFLMDCSRNALMPLKKEETTLTSIPTYPIKNYMIDMPETVDTPRIGSYYSKKKKPNTGFSIGSYKYRGR